MPTLHDIAAEHAQRVARQYAAPIPPVPVYQAAKGNSLFTAMLGDLEVQIEFFYRAPVAGRTWGPPEDCYEDDPGEFDFVWIVIGGVRVEPDQFAPDVLATWELAIREAADEQHNDAMAARAERERDYD